EFGQDCRDVSCAVNEHCIVSHVACERDQLDGEHCGLYPRCLTDPFADQQLIDTTSTTANTRSSTLLSSSPITSTLTLTHQPKLKSQTDFELLAPNPIVADPAASHAAQRQANVLVIVQEGNQQPNLNPNTYPNYNNQPWRQPCSPYYPYACNYPSSPYLPTASRSMPAYGNARAASGPQLVPPTPPCYYNCYPRLAAGYPFARSARASSQTNNYLMYITI
ncbi:hypothetical protein KR215_002941, partial [Drosophila sulfurigaster]